MKKLLTSVSLLVLSSAPLTALATVYAVKVECNGDCLQVSTTNACKAVAVDQGLSYTLWPVSVSCDNTSSHTADGAAPSNCGGGACAPVASGYSLLGLPISDICNDGGGDDAIVMCGRTDSGLSPGYKTLTVECNGNCNNVTLGNVCTSWAHPVGLTCDETATRGTGRDVTNGTCGTNGTLCRQWGQLQSTDKIGDYCADGSGRDAVVSCANNSEDSTKVGVVKVECGGDCNKVKVGDVCGTLGSSTPLQIACDDTGGSGVTYEPCDDSFGSSDCKTHGRLSGTDRIGDYCKDGSGNDATVTCQM
jgi:hypothetical protein